MKAYFELSRQEYAFQTEKRKSANAPWTAGLNLKNPRDSLEKEAAKGYVSFWGVELRSDGSDASGGMTGGGRPTPCTPARWCAMGATRSSPAFFNLMNLCAKNRTKDMGTWRSSPRTRWSASLAPKCKGKSSRRTAAGSLSASFNHARLGLGFLGFCGTGGKTRCGVKLKAFIGLGEVKSRINRDREGFGGVPV